MKLNIGAGDVEIDGFESVDRKHGGEAYPLNYEANSVEEIRASHILEHFGWADVRNVVADWVRVLKPGGTIRIAVPDVRKILACDDPRWKHFLMGGQTDDNDYHRSCWDESALRSLMAGCGLVDVKPWESENTDCASLPISLNLEGTKSATPQPSIEKPPVIASQATLPRYGSHVAMQSIYTAFADCGLRIYPSFGAYWHECMERDFETIVNAGSAEWIYTVDSDSMITARHVGMLVKAMLQNPEMDALCAVQPKRQVDEQLTSHFGLTILKVEPLKSLPKPWFRSQPSPANDWNEGRLEADRYFWQQWMEHGYRVANLAQCRIGHLEECVAFYDDDDQHRCLPVQGWLDHIDKTHANPQ